MKLVKCHVGPNAHLPGFVVSSAPFDKPPFAGVHPYHDISSPIFKTQEKFREYILVHEMPLLRVFVT